MVSLFKYHQLQWDKCLGTLCHTQENYSIEIKRIISIHCEDYVRIHNMNLNWFIQGNNATWVFPPPACHLSLVTTVGTVPGLYKEVKGQPSMTPQQWGCQWGLAGNLEQSLIHMLNIWEKCSIINFWTEYCWLWVKHILISLWICAYFIKNLLIYQRKPLINQKGLWQNSQSMWKTLAQYNNSSW